MSSPSRARSLLVLLLVTIGLGLPAAGQKTGGKALPPKLGPKPAEPPGASTPAEPSGARPRAPTAGEQRVLASLRGPSPKDENEGGEQDPPFEPFDWLRSRKTTASLDATSSSASARAPLAEHPQRDELVRWLVDGLRGKEIDVALLGGRKYMINDCLGLKASAGTFRLKLANPEVRFEGTRLLVRFEIDHVSISAIKIRIRPNPNPLEVCKFSKKFEVGGALDDVRLTFRCDPLYELERCRLSSFGNVNPEVRIGNLNLKPLQNDLDRMAKNLIEDSLTLALELEVDGIASRLGELVISLIDQFLEADCPTRPGDTARAIGDLRRATGLGGGPAPQGGGAAAGGSLGSGTSSTYTDEEVLALLARIEQLESRVAELEAAGGPPSGIEDVLRQALQRLDELGNGASAPPALAPMLQDLLARLLATTVERGFARGEEALAVIVARTRDTLASVEPQSDARGASVQPGGRGAAPPPAWSLVRNAELKGRLGRIVVHFPDEKLAKNTLVGIFRNGERVADHYGDADWELLPERYDVRVTNATVPGCEVRSGNDTVVRVGLLTVELAKDTLFALYARGGQERLYDHYGSTSVGLPEGGYDLEIQGQRAAVEVRAGEITRF